MSEDINEDINNELDKAQAYGRLEGLEWAERYLKEESGRLFVLHKDEFAHLLRLKSCTLHQEVELMRVKIEKLKALQGKKGSE